MHWRPIKHPDLTSCKCFDRSSTYAPNRPNRADNMPPCLTSFTNANIFIETNNHIITKLIYKQTLCNTTKLIDKHKQSW